MTTDNAIPWGTTAWLPEDCRRLRECETILRAAFTDAGGEEIAVPTLEFAQATEKGFGHSDELFRLLEKDGSALALRPDMTAPAARLFASALADRPRPVRLYYFGQVYRQRPTHRGHYREFRQAGFEWYGGDRAEADAAVIRLASSSLSRLGYSDAVIEIGHVGIAEALMDEAGVSSGKRAAVTSALAAKDRSSLIREGASSELVRLSALGVAMEEFPSARSLSSNKAYQSALDDLESLAGHVRGLVHRVVIEFSAVRRMEYYTGMVFEAYVPGEGRGVVSGGRYDRLVELFGAPAPATGFSLELERLIRGSVRG